MKCRYAGVVFDPPTSRRAQWDLKHRGSRFLTLTERSRSPQSLMLRVRMPSHAHACRTHTSTHSVFRSHWLVVLSMGSLGGCQSSPPLPMPCVIDSLGEMSRSPTRCHTCQVPILPLRRETQAAICQGGILEGGGRGTRETQCDSAFLFFFSSFFR